MQAVSNETAIPPETLRSWESRHGFPEPVRNKSNRRLYSERDIISLAWLRDQTNRGQGISEAIEMLRKISGTLGAPTLFPNRAPHPEVILPIQQPLLPVQTLTDALLVGDLERAQSVWDHLSIATSPDGLCSDVIVPAHARIAEPGTDRDSQLRAIAFLLRKVTVLFDHSSPDHGVREAVVLRTDDDTTLIPATALATVLSRGGYRLHFPIMDARDSRTMFALSAAELSGHVILVAPGKDAPQLDGLRRFLPEATCLGWWPAYAARPDTADWLTASLLDVVAELSRSR